MGNIIGLLLVVLALAVGGCVRVVWAARGGPDGYASSPD